MCTQYRSGNMNRKKPARAPLVKLTTPLEKNCAIHRVTARLYRDRRVVWRAVGGGCRWHVAGVCTLSSPLTVCNTMITFFRAALFDPHRQLTGNITFASDLSAAWNITGTKLTLLTFVENLAACCKGHVTSYVVNAVKKNRPKFSLFTKRFSYNILNYRKTNHQSNRNNYNIGLLIQ